MVAKTVFVNALSKMNKKNQLQKWSTEEFEEAAKLFETQDGIITVDQFRKFSFGINNRKLKNINKKVNQDNVGMELQQWSTEKFDEATKIFKTLDGILLIDQFRKFCIGMKENCKTSIWKQIRIMGKCNLSMTNLYPQKIVELRRFVTKFWRKLHESFTPAVPKFIEGLVELGSTI